MTTTQKKTAIAMITTQTKSVDATNINTVENSATLIVKEITAVRFRFQYQSQFQYQYPIILEAEDAETKDVVAEDVVVVAEDVVEDAETKDVDAEDVVVVAEAAEIAGIIQLTLVCTVVDTSVNLASCQLSTRSLSTLSLMTMAYWISCIETAILIAIAIQPTKDHTSMVEIIITEF